jgi:hypothetical protein
MHCYLIFLCRTGSWICIFTTRTSLVGVYRMGALDGREGTYCAPVFYARGMFLKSEGAFLCYFTCLDAFSAWLMCRSGKTCTIRI